MGETIALFPLGTVLYPGLLLPLHVFEERYRQLVRDLMDSKELMRFGVVAIREGRETGKDGIKALYEVGCTAVVRRVNEHDDGRFDLVTVGDQRFRLGRVDSSAPYLRAEVEFLAEEAGEEMAAGRAVREVREAFGTYLDALSARGVSQAGVPELPEDPVTLSYLVAASVVANLPDKQALLAAPDAMRRLSAERALLARERPCCGPSRPRLPPTSVTGLTVRTKVGAGTLCFTVTGIFRGITPENPRDHSGAMEGVNA